MVVAFLVPNFGKFVLGLLGVLVALAVVGGAYLYQRNKKEQEAEALRISRDQVELVDLQPPPQYAGSYKLAGRVRNKSQRFTLTELTLKISLRDCVAPGSCETIGETVETAWVSVPPQQARGLDEYVLFSNLAPSRGNLEWDWEVTGLKGR